MNRLEDAKIAVEKYGWQWQSSHGGREILMPPEDDDRWHWTAIWDEEGIPNWLPRFSKGETD
ncbi:hypothetical protein [Halobacillus litoralis]|uniref:hypothetical protein n=1 Tax=Halobacillus litoralis TaxID=45668 RepID=UPI001CD2795F|nr:hypothetical protein [Halobacillus litoralis]MCA1021507.1 hypothetical protein [Halobacillus litoralis]